MVLPDDTPAPYVATVEERNPLQAVQDALSSLNGSAMRRVAEWIASHPEESGRASITRIALEAGTTPASVTRLAGYLGYAGFPALRSAIATENGRDLQVGWESDFGAVLAIDDPPDRVLKVLAGAEMNALRNALGGVDLGVASRIAEAMSSAARIHVYGEWGDGIAARELSVRLLRIGLPAWSHESAESTRVIADTLSAGDVAIVVSRTGQNAIAQEFIDRAASHGALTAVITGEPESPLARQAEFALFTGTRAAVNWTGYIAGRASDSLVANFLVVLVSQRVPNATRYQYPFESERAAGGESR